MPLAPPRLLIAPDARAAARELARLVEDDAAAVRADLARLARPLRVVVPGGSLREAVLDALAQGRGRALAGVVVQTLWSLALEVLEADGASVRTGALRFELELRRAVAAEPALARDLADLEDGAGLAAAAVGDLASAGLTEVGERELAAALGTLGPRERERALALVRVARASSAALAHERRLRHPDVYAAAARALAARPYLLAARVLAIHGFASATGRARALLEVLGGREEATWIAVRPPQAHAALELARRALVGGAPERELAAEAPSELAAFRAAGFDDEARETALRVRALLDAGARPEGIAVVARALEPRAAALRRWFLELGVPFGGAREPAGFAPAARRLAAALEVLRDGPRAGVERWFDALDRSAGPAREDLRCALAAAGVLRLEELARVDAAPWVAGRTRVALPQRGAAGEGDAAAQRPRRRTLAGEDLARAARDARGALATLADWPERADPARQLAAWRAFARGLGLADESALRARLDALEAVFDELEGLDPGPDRPELARLLAQALEGLETPALGGAGAGVRVLDAQSARGAGFEHLFLLGCERGVFPRAPRGDALLGPAVRAALARLAPELVTRERAEDEERWLFASLAGAAPRLVVSWRHADLDGREIAPSPAVAALLAERGVEPRRLERRRERLFVDAPCNARERAVGVALAGDRRALAAALGAAFEEARERFGDAFLPRGADALELARARATLLAEYEPERGSARARAAGPYLGLAGAGALGEGDGIFVTNLESLARCPWQAFLQRGLGLEPPPDPLADLPDLDALALGNAVHGALQELLVRPSCGEAELQVVLKRAAARALAEAGVHLAGLALALARRARPLVERGLALASTLSGAREVEVEGRTRSGLRFRADLLARGQEGAVLVDFKTGKPLSEAVKESTRHEHLKLAIRRGSHLQAAAYADSEGALRGEYLYLREDARDEVARVAVERDGEFAEDYAEAVKLLADAWRAGAVPPRPEEPDGRPNAACSHCDVRGACLRDDSGVRARLRDLVEEARLEGSEDATLGVLAGLWSLGADMPAGDEA